MSIDKSSADLEREVQQQRDRVEARIDEIKDRLSPGQLLDEALSYTKSGGAQFASNLGQQITANPLPAALVGVGLAWLISSSANAGSHGASASGLKADSHAYPYANVKSGGLRRVSHSADESGEWWSEFESSTGARYKAKSNSLGERASHFTDDAGKVFSGFIDEAGNRVRDFQDDAGNMLGDAQGWANHSWHDVRDAIGDGLHAVGSAAKHAASGVTSGGRHLGGTVHNQTDQLSRQISSLFDQQPLIAGALAFAAGAALGAALPHTDQEDQLIGKQADKLRDQAGKAAGELYEQGKDKAAELYEDVSDKAADLYSETKGRVTEGASSGNGSDIPTITPASSRH